MGAAAGAAVRAGEGHDPHIPFQRLFAPVVDGLQLRSPVELNVDGVVFVKILIGLSLDLQQLLPGNISVEVDGHDVRAHVKSHIVAVKPLTDQPGTDVLSGVLLHMVKPPSPVNGAGDSFPDFHGSVHIVENHAVFFVDVRHHCSVQNAVIGRLSAPLRVEGRAV